MAKPIRALELHYPMIQFLIIHSINLNYKHWQNTKLWNTELTSILFYSILFYFFYFIFFYFMLYYAMLCYVMLCYVICMLCLHVNPLNLHD